MNEYRTASWHAFRNEIIHLDNYACVQCGRQQADGAVLQVHHKHYIPGRRPWDYSHHLCVALCKSCHAAEHGLIPPKFGWELIGHDDLGDLLGECEFCGTAIRHSFMISHPKWRAIEVGEQCCDHLTCTLAATDHIESLRRHGDRRNRFVSSSRWRVEPHGVHTIKQKTLYVQVVPLGPAYKLRIDWELGKQLFPSVLHAKAAAFDLVESGALDEWRERRRLRKRARGDPFNISPGGVPRG